MRFVPSWRIFRRMQLSAAVAACLIYAAAAVYAWSVLPGPDQLKLQRIVLFPALFALVSLVLPLSLRPVRLWLSLHVWRSYRWGFGQTPVSVLSGLGVLAALAAFIYWQTHQAARGVGLYPGGVFSGYAAGIGILLAQLMLGRRLERDPAMAPLISDR
jgi:hypothetical protein